MLRLLSHIIISKALISLPPTNLIWIADPLSLTKAVHTLRSIGRVGTKVMYLSFLIQSTPIGILTLQPNKTRTKKLIGHNYGTSDSFERGCLYEIEK